MDAAASTSPAEEVSALVAGRENIDTFFSQCNLKDEVKVISTRTLENRVSALSEKEVKLFWTNNTLQSYKDCGRAPRGLRNYKEPSQYQDDHEFLLKWKKVHMMYSMNLLTIILDRSKVEYEQVQADLNAANEELQTHLTEVQWLNSKKKIEKKLVPIQNEIKERKRDKFMRDKMDYELDRVFSWKNLQKSRRTMQQGRFKRNRRPLKEYWTTDSGSDSSADVPVSGHDNEVVRVEGTLLPQTPLGAARAEGAEKRGNLSNRAYGTRRKQVSWRR